MDQAKDQIRGGIDFEESIIEVLANDIFQLTELKSISPESRDKIVTLLTTMKDDSIRHRDILKNIINKY